MTLTQAIRHPHHLILLGTPRSGKSDALANCGDIVYIDIARQLTSKDGEPFELNHDTIVLDNFEFHLGHRKADAQRLKGLENLLSRTRNQLTEQPARRLKIVLVTTVDPMYWFSPDAELYSHPAARAREDVELEQRWEFALAAFDRARWKHDSTLGRHQYSLLWSTCTGAEKAALYQIAREGWANNRNEAALIHLTERNLLKKEYCYKLADEGFGKWIRESVPKEEYVNLRGQEAAPLFDSLRVIFVVLLALAAAAGLFLTGQDILASVAAVGGVLSTLLTAAGKLFTPARSGRAQPEAAEGE